MTKRVTRDKYTFVAPGLDPRVLKQFGISRDLGGLNVLTLAYAVFQVEQALRQGNIRRVIIPLHCRNKAHHDLSTLKDLVRELLIFTLVQDVEVEFQLRTHKEPGPIEPTQLNPVSAICLFSGGLDSYAGLLLTKKVYENVLGLFCAHADQPRIIHIVENLRRHWLEDGGFKLEKVPVPSIGAHGYAQVRGFLYLLCAGAWAHKLRASRIVVTECGPTMYQPRFSPVDSITMTTHPFVVQKAMEVMDVLLPGRLRLSTPFEDLTKAEVAAICPLKKGLKETHSCVSSRFGTHDGTCYGCVIRRLATTTAEVDDVKYEKNPLVNRRAKAGNLFSLLTFCADILLRYDRMEEFEIGTIESYGKKDLFRRFALDNFAAIHRIISQNKRVQPAIGEMYTRVTQRIGVSELQKRITVLSNRPKTPKFS